MSHNKIAALIALALGTLPIAASQAGEANFVGPTIGARLSFVDNEVDYSGFLAGRSSSENDMAFDLTAGYGFNLGKDWVLNVGASYSVNDTDFGTITYVDGGNQTLSAELKDHWSVSVEPGYRFTPQWLGYVSLSYHSAEGEYRDSQLGSDTVDIDGFGYGLGLSYAVTRNVEVGAELKRIDFSRERVNQTDDGGEPEVTQFGLRLNYRF